MLWWGDVWTIFEGDPALFKCWILCVSIFLSKDGDADGDVAEALDPDSWTLAYARMVAIVSWFGVSRAVIFFPFCENDAGQFIL